MNKMEMSENVARIVDVIQCMWDERFSALRAGDMKRYDELSAALINKAMVLCDVLGEGLSDDVAEFSVKGLLR